MHKILSSVNLANVTRANILPQLCSMHYKDFLKFWFTFTILWIQTSINNHIFLLFQCSFIFAFLPGVSFANFVPLPPWLQCRLPYVKSKIFVLATFNYVWRGHMYFTLEVFLNNTAVKTKLIAFFVACYRQYLFFLKLFSHVE